MHRHRFVHSSVEPHTNLCFTRVHANGAAPRAHKAGTHLGIQTLEDSAEDMWGQKQQGWSVEGQGPRHAQAQFFFT